MSAKTLYNVISRLQGQAGLWCFTDFWYISKPASRFWVSISIYTD